MDNLEKALLRWQELEPEACYADDELGRYYAWLDGKAINVHPEEQDYMDVATILEALVKRIKEYKFSVAGEGVIG